MVATNMLAQLKDNSSTTLGLVVRELRGAANRAWTRLVNLFREPCPAWWDLSDRMLTDIGKTPAEAEFEALRRSWSGETRRSVLQSTRSVLRP
jgi:uncharacterized protein YjiS (DUF1127 family)